MAFCSSRPEQADETTFKFRKKSSEVKEIFLAWTFFVITKINLRVHFNLLPWRSSVAILPCRARQPRSPRSPRDLPLRQHLFPQHLLWISGPTLRSREDFQPPQRSGEAFAPPGTFPGQAEAPRGNATAPGWPCGGGPTALDPQHRGARDGAGAASGIGGGRRARGEGGRKRGRSAGVHSPAPRSGRRRVSFLPPRCSRFRFLDLEGPLGAGWGTPGPLRPPSPRCGRGTHGVTPLLVSSTKLKYS